MRLNINTNAETWAGNLSPAQSVRRVVLWHLMSLKPQSRDEKGAKKKEKTERSPIIPPARLRVQLHLHRQDARCKWSHASSSWGWGGEGGSRWRAMKGCCSQPALKWFHVRWGGALISLHVNNDEPPPCSGGEAEEPQHPRDNRRTCWGSAAPYPTSEIAT